MPTSKEMKEWAYQRDLHRRLVEAKRAARYMADVRHPLKPRPMDDRVEKALRGPRRPYEQKPEVPNAAPCSKCGTMVSLNKWWFHECFGTRFVK